MPRIQRDVYPGAPGTFLPPFPKVTPTPPNPLGLPSVDHLVQQQQVPQTETVPSERPGFTSQLCCPQVVSPQEKLPTSLSLSILPCKTGSTNSICLAGCSEDKGDGVGAMLSSELATSAEGTAAATAPVILSRVCRAMAGCPHWSWNAQESNLGSTGHSLGPNRSLFLAACPRRF